MGRLSAKPLVRRCVRSAVLHVTAKFPNHVRHVDLAAVPIVGFRVPWLPFALSQMWRLYWWICQSSRLPAAVFVVGLRHAA